MDERTDGYLNSLRHGLVRVAKTLYLSEDTVQYNYIVQKKIGIAQMLESI